MLSPLLVRHSFHLKARFILLLLLLFAHFIEPSKTNIKQSVLESIRWCPCPISQVGSPRKIRYVSNYPINCVQCFYKNTKKRHLYCFSVPLQKNSFDSSIINVVNEFSNFCHLLKGCELKTKTCRSQEIASE